jgi:hypothetical protein
MWKEEFKIFVVITSNFLGSVSKCVTGAMRLGFLGTENGCYIGEVLCQWVISI